MISRTFVSFIMVHDPDQHHCHGLTEVQPLRGGLQDRI